MKRKHWIILSVFSYATLCFALAIITEKPWAQWFAVPMFVSAYAAYFLFLDAGD